MKTTTLNISQAVATHLVAYPWILIDGTNSIHGAYTSRTLAREAKAAGMDGKVANIKEYEINIVNAAPVEKIKDAPSDDYVPHGFETHGFTHCPHCNIDLSNGVLQNGEEDGNGKRMKFETNEFYCMGCGAEFGPELKATQAKAKKVRDPITHESTVDRPCTKVWEIADEMKGQKRSVVLEACVAAGIAFYTARTQYQQWRVIQREMAEREAQQAQKAAK